LYFRIVYRTLYRKNNRVKKYLKVLFAGRNMNIVW
jgi:hypothetical protein